MATTGVPDWVAQGPTGVFGQQNLNLPTQGNPIAGAANTVLADPSDPNTLYVATNGGGVWVTHNALIQNLNGIHWQPLTDGYPSAITGLAMDPLDPRTLYAGDAVIGGSQTGFLKTTDGGQSWTPLGTGLFSGQNIAIVPTTITEGGGRVVLAGADNGLFRSADGVTWTRVAAGSVRSIVADPSDPMTFYAGIPGQGLLRSTDGGRSWNPFNGNLGPQAVAASTNVQVAVYNNPSTSPGRVFYVVLDVPNPGGPNIHNILWSPGDGNWQPMDNLSRNDYQGRFSILPDQNDPNVLFITGYQSGVDRGDRSLPAGSQWQGMNGSAANNTEPHVDGWRMSFDNLGNLLQTDDGGIYRLISPDDPGTRTWQSVNGDISPTQFYTVAYDPLNNMLIGGTQDNGVMGQLSQGTAQAWGAEEDLGGQLTSAPAIASWGPTRLDVFYRGQNNHLWHRSWDNAHWNPEEDLGGVLTSSPAAVSWGFNRIDIFYRGQNNDLWHRSWDGAQWNPEEDLGGQLSSAPTVASWGVNRLDVFYRGLNNHLWHRSWDGAQWNPEEDLGGVLTSSPAAVSWGFNRIDVFYRGQNNDLWHRSWDGAQWNPEEDLGGQLSSSPAVSSWGFNRLDVFYRGLNNQLWRRTWDGAQWINEEDVGGVLASDPAAVSSGPYRIDTFYVGQNNDLWHRANLGVAPFSPGTWGGVAGGDGSMVQVDTTSEPGVAYQYYSNPNLANFTRRRVNVATGVDSRTGVALIVQGTGGQNLYQVDGNRPWVTPYVLNAVDPRRMLIGTNSLYESFDRGDTLTNLGSLGRVNPDIVWPFHPMVYGGWSGGVAYPDLIWAGAGGNLYQRTSGSGAPTLVSTYSAVGGATVLSIAVDPAKWREAFVMDVNGNIWHTTDGGQTTGNWTNVRGVTGQGSIGDLTTGMQELAFYRSGSTEVLLVSSQDGVYRTINPGASAVWRKFGRGLPHAVVTDLHYYAGADLLVAGTYGRGVWTVPNASASLATPGTLTINLDPGEAVRLRADANLPRVLDVLTSGGSDGNLSLDAAALQQITIDASAGNQIDLEDVPAGVAVTVNGGTGSDTVNVGNGNLDNLPGAVTVNGAGGTTAVNVNDQSAPFSDTYTITSSSLTRPFFGGLTYGGVTGLTLNAETGNNTVNVNSTAAGTPVTVNGGGGTNTLVGPNANDTWNITASNAGTMDGNVTFSAVQNLTGGTANDTFKFSNGMGVTGAINGGGGTNTLDYSLYATGVTVNLLAGTATGTGRVSNVHSVTGSPKNDTITGDNAGDVINGNGGMDVLKGGTGNDKFLLGTAQLAGTTVTGNGGTDTLVGANIANTWTLTGAGAGTLNGLVTFSGIANLTGGTGTDTFKFSGAGAGVSGTIAGGTGTNTLDYSSNGGGAIAVNLAAGTATSTGGISGITKLVGSSATSNTLTGLNATNTWSITGANAGTVGTFSFSAIQNLNGGTMNDTFKLVGAAAGVSGTINGGGGTTNTLDYSGNGGGAVSVNLATGAATATRGISGVNVLVGSTAGGNTLTGPNATNAWSITAANAGKVNAVSYSKFAKLVGGTGVDVFKFSNLGTEASVAGGGAPAHQGDWLDYSGDTIAVTVNLATGAATNVNGGAAGSVTGIQDVHGGNGGNTLTGNSQGNILIGGTGTNTIHGGSGRSILIADAGASTITGGSAASASGGDILIAGTTSYDTMTAAHEASLMSVLAEWQSADPPATRFSDINTGTGGGLNGSNKLNWGTTVLDNGKANTLTAPPGAVAVDWFFANEAAGHTKVNNRKPGDHTNNT
jgi:hypothetical protein